MYATSSGVFCAIFSFAKMNLKGITNGSVIKQDTKYTRLSSGFVKRGVRERTHIARNTSESVISTVLAKISNTVSNFCPFGI